MKWLSIILVLILLGCEQSTEIKTTDLTGRYQNADYGMIMLVEHNYTHVTASLEWSGYITNLDGVFDAKNNQVIMSGNYFGTQNLSFDLFVGSDNSLTGSFNYNGQGSRNIKFILVNKLYKHDQGSINIGSY